MDKAHGSPLPMEPAPSEEADEGCDLGRWGADEGYDTGRPGAEEDHGTGRRHLCGDMTSGVMGGVRGRYCFRCWCLVFPRGQCACVGESACYGRSDLGTLLHRRSRGTSAGGLLPSSPGSPPVLCRGATHSGWGRRLRQAGRKRQGGNQVWIRTLQMKPTTFPADRGWAGAGTSPRENNGAA